MLPLRRVRQAPAGPAAVGLGFPGADVDEHLVVVDRQPVVEPAVLPFVALAAPAHGMVAPAAAPPHAGRAGPAGRIVVAAVLDEFEKLPGQQRRQIDLEVGDLDVVALQLVVEGEAALPGRPADAHRAAGHPHLAAGHVARQHHVVPRRMVRRRVAEGGAQGSQGLDVHGLVQQRQAVEIQRRVVVVD